MDTLTRMRAFLAVVENEGFSAAARRTGRSKALLSKYVRELEDELGVLLINRTTRQVALTAAGEVYRARAAAILADLEALHEEAREASGEASGRIRVSAARSFGDADLGRALVEFAIAHPAISLEIDLDDGFVNLVEEGYDLAIRMTRMADSSLIARRLAGLRLILCASPAVIERHGRPSHPGELAALPLLIDSNARQQTGWVFAEPGTGAPILVPVASRFSVNSPFAIREAMLAGLGYAIAPDFVVRRDLAEGRLVELLPDFAPPPSGIFAVFPHRRHLPARTRVFVDFLASWFRDNGETP